MKPLTIKLKLYGGFGILVVLTVCLGAYGVTELNAIQASVGKMEVLAEHVARTLQNVNNLEKMRRTVLRYIYDHDKSSLKENGEVAAEIIPALQAAEREAVSAERRRMYGDLAKSVAASQKTTQAVVEMVERVGTEQGRLLRIDHDLTAGAQALLNKVKFGADQPNIAMAGKLDSELSSVRAAGWRAQATLDPRDITLFADAVSTASSTIAALEGAERSREIRELIEAVKVALADYAATTPARVSNLKEIGGLHLTEIAPQIIQMQVEIATAADRLQQDFRHTRSLVEKSISGAVIAQEIIAGLALMLGGLIAFLIARSVSGPIASLTRSMHELADGNFDVVLPGLDRKDEVGNIAKAVETFKVKAAEKAQREAEQKAEQDRRADVEREAAMARVAQEFQAAIGGIVEAAVAGDFSKRVEIEAKTGLILNIGSSINTLCDNVGRALNDFAQMLGAMATGDLSRRMIADYQGDFAELKNNANTTAERVAQTIGEIRASTREVTNAASEISASTTDLSQRTEEQAASLEQTSASMEQLASTVKTNSENARQANQSTGNARDVADRSGQIVTKAVGAMAQIEMSSRKISDIIGVIDEIARQTNLLALNAAVEAARAGNAGRGFAVVASEVRALAQRSSQAAKDIKDLITGSTNQVHEGVELVNKAGVALAEIVESIREVAALVSGIATASIEQAGGIEEINKALAQMDEVTQRNSAVVEENAATAKALEQRAKAMDEQVSFFRLDQSATPAGAGRFETRSAA